MISIRKILEKFKIKENIMKMFQLNICFGFK